MPAKTPAHQQFYKMFLEQLRDIYSAEDQIINSLPEILNRISTEELRNKLKNHSEEIKKQKQRLEKVFKQLNESPSGKFCEGMKGLLQECSKIANESGLGVVKDAALISALQKIKHYQIATYGALKTFAKHLEEKKVEKQLKEILDEEWKADKKLTKVAEGGWFTSGINAEALKAG